MELQDVVEVQDVVLGLKAVREAIEVSGKFIESLPLFARSFAEQDFAAGTGMSYEEWLRNLDSIIPRLERLSQLSSSERAELVRELEWVSPRLERYASYLLAIPDRIRIAASFVRIDEQTLKAAQGAPCFADTVKDLKAKLDSLIERLKSQ